MTSIHDQIVTNQNHTQQYQATLPKASSNQMDGDMFLQLLTQQLQYQDPLNPMDNKDMLAQEAQFASLEQMESLAKSFSHFANVFQASSLMGQKVEVQTSFGKVTGKVEYIDYTDANGANVCIDGNIYSIANITKVYPENAPEASKGETNNENTTGQTLLETISDNIQNIATKVCAYLDKE